VFSKFKYERIPLSLIKLDFKNPRIVTPENLKSEDEIVKYFFEHEGLSAFLKKIAHEGRNQGAERPYVVKIGKEYTVVEGNTRIATYKLLTGLLVAPNEYINAVPNVANAMKEDLMSVDCTIAPSRDSLLPIMANAHFGVGDKSKWGYLGSRKAVYDEWVGGKSIAQLAIAFDRKQGQIRDLILDYKLYQVALEYDWTAAERQALLDPSVEFNPPVRFLQTLGHKSAIGIDYDRVNLAVLFASDEAKRKFRHLVKKLVINSEKGVGATATYEGVFSDYIPETPPSSMSEDADDTPSSNGEGEGSASGDKSTSGGGASNDGDSSNSDTPHGGSKLKKGALFNYPASGSNLLIVQLMKEAKDINANKLPAAATALLRCIVEAILKSIIDDQNGNQQNKLLSLETALDICLGNTIQLGLDDKKILKEFKKSHLEYVNLGTHATVIPNTLRLMAARDCIDQFVMRNV